jgi:hypothetical protein
MKHANADNFAKTGNFKNTNILISIQNLRVEKAGVFVQVKGFQEDHLSCSISDKFFQQIQILVNLE